MISKACLTVGCMVALGWAVSAQNLPPRLPPAPASAPAPSLQSAADPGYAALIAMCKTPPPPGRGRGAGARGGAAGAAPAPVPGIREYTVPAIPGVIAGAQKWTFLWQEAGNNGDGILGTDDGALLLAHHDNSA